MARLRVRSIRGRLRVLVLATTGLALAVASVAFAVDAVTSFRSELARQGTVLAQVVGANSVAALVFADPGAGAETLAALEASPHVLDAALYDADGEVFATWGRSAGPRVPDRPGAEGVAFSDGTLELFRPVTHQGRRVGTVFLRSDTTALNARMLRYAAILAGVLLGSAALVWAVSSRLQRQVAGPIGELVASAEAMARGDLTVRAPAGRDDELGILAGAFDQMASRLRALVGRVRAGAGSLAEAVGTLRTSGAHIRTGASSQQEALERAGAATGRITASVRRVNESVERLSQESERTRESVLSVDASSEDVAAHMEQLRGTVDSISSAISELTASIRSIAGGVDTLRQATGGTVASLGQIRSSVERVQENAERTRAISERTEQESHRGSAAVASVVESMDHIRDRFAAIAGAVSDLSQRSQAIGEIVEVIDPVAAETSLLSLNARIIAAQAGEHGRAFGVVAEQVSGLAERTTGSAKQIAELIREVQGRIAAVVQAVEEGSATVDAGVERSGEAGQLLHSIRDIAGQSSERVRDIAAATDDQGRDLATVEEAVEQVRQLVERFGGAVEEQDRASGEIIRAVEETRQLAAETGRSVGEQRASSKEITEAVQAVAVMVRDIRDATREQLGESQTIEDAFGVFRQTAETATERAEELGRLVGSLSARAEELERELGQLRL